jgi:hypothetical protein
MNLNGKRIIFYFGIVAIFSGIATILSSPVFFEKRIFEEQIEDEITVKVTVEPTTEHSFLEPTTDETMRTTLAAATTTETTMTTFAVKEEPLPFCLEEPISTVD